jgi:2-oxoglutarate dehydrogenase E1 component
MRLSMSGILVFPSRHLQELGKKLEKFLKPLLCKSKFRKYLEDRTKMWSGNLEFNWGAAETLAYATVLNDGHLIRITGQDVGRGTFSHRHAILYSQKDNTAYVPLKNLRSSPAVFRDV